MFPGNKAPYEEIAFYISSLYRHIESACCIFGLQEVTFPSSFINGTSSISMHYKEKVFPAAKESTKSKHSKCNSARPNHLLLGDHLDEDEVERGKTRLVPGTRNYS